MMEKAQESEESMPAPGQTHQYIIDVSNLNVNFGRLHVLKDIALHIEPRKVTVIMGPSGCGKSTFVRTLNRMNDHVSDFQVSGKVEFNGVDIYSKEVDPALLRLKVGMVFQKPNPFPMSIYENVAFGPKIHKMCSTKQQLDDRVKRSLEQAALWDEVKNRLKEDALKLSGGQQQRLCIARALAVNPEIILFDEPASALDPGSTAKIEELIVELRKNYTVILVTHNMQQAARVGNTVIFLYGGGIVEIGEVPKIFEKPTNELTEKYIRGELV